MENIQILPVGVLIMLLQRLSLLRSIVVLKQIPEVVEQYCMHYQQAFCLLMKMLFQNYSKKLEVTFLLHSYFIDGQYRIPSHFSAKARSLVKKMLEVNPIKRMKFYEIKMHPWLTESNPDLNDFFGFQKCNNTCKIVDEVYAKLKGMGLEFNGMPERDIQDAIKKRKEYSFVITYEMLYDKHLTQKQSICNENNENYVFAKISNILKQAINDSFTHQTQNYFISNDQEQLDNNYDED
eukprot:TRINITY_DN37085_c0_g1_i1.p1 TRINITY_DN37085_c0_g1~~TRINITY_DN37085_c0_g1_i1.p1  ORF type:complete len:237 (+),score=27.94 TRINITY_DN37085_c0_g1_i1:147-857(+)